MGSSLTIEEKIINAKKVHGNKYDYSIFIVKNSRDKGQVICPLHGIWETNYGNHVCSKHGCPDCGLESRISKRKLTYEQKIQRLKQRYNTTYMFNYIPDSIYEFFCVYCYEHGWFNTTYSKLMYDNTKCPRCSNKAIQPLLNTIVSLDFNYFTEWTGNEEIGYCINQQTNRALRFDIYVPYFNLAIEYHGELHLISDNHHISNEDVQYRNKCVSIKKKWANDKKLNYVEYWFTDEDIPYKLYKLLTENI